MCVCVSCIGDEDDDALPAGCHGRFPMIVCSFVFINLQLRSNLVETGVRARFPSDEVHCELCVWCKYNDDICSLPCWRPAAARYA